MKQYTPYAKFMNVDVIGCFDNISHKSMVEKIPLTNKYVYIVKAWLRATVVGPTSFTDKKVRRIIPESGVPQGSIIGPLLCNIVLDGLESEIYSVCLKNTHYELNTAQADFAKEKIGVKNLNARRETNIHCIRFADDIIIFGLADRNTMVLIEAKLVEFLAR